MTAERSAVIVPLLNHVGNQATCAPNQRNCHGYPTVMLLKLCHRSKWRLQEACSIQLASSLRRHTRPCMCQLAQSQRRPWVLYEGVGSVSPDQKDTTNWTLALSHPNMRTKAAALK